MKIIGIAGGSGSGKSTAAYALADSDPAKFEVLNFDDYQKVNDDADLPYMAGMINWDHPDVIRWDKLLADIERLKDGQSVTIESWAHRSNPDYARHRRKITRVVKPRPILIIEGYLALYNPELNALYDKRFYLDLDEDTRKARRSKDVGYDEDDYYGKVLRPMHAKYVEPTRRNADIVIDASGMTPQDIARRIRSLL